MTIFNPESFAPNIKAVFDEWGLYRHIDFPTKAEISSFLFDFLNAPFAFDAFCPECRRESHFRISHTAQYNLVQPLVLARTRPVDQWGDDFHSRVFICSRNAQHRAFVALLKSNLRLTKIGQYPSYADLQDLKLADVRNVLGNDRALEIKKALGLFSHGVGAGSLIYLRRSLEQVVHDAEELATAAGDTVDSKARFPDRIKATATYLPQFFVENRIIYGIISSGIHEQTEEWCLEAFPVAWDGLRLILMQRAAKKEQEALEAKAAKDIAALSKQIQKPSE